VVFFGTFAVAGCGESAKPGDDAGPAGQAGSSGSSAGMGTSGGSSAGGGSSGTSGGTGGESGQGGGAGSTAGSGATSGRSGAGGADGSGGRGGNAGDAAAGASAGVGEAGASAGSAAGGNAGAPNADCNGQFGEPRVVLDSGPEIRVYSPTLSADELELLYSATDVAGSVKEFRRSTRSSKLDAFEPGATMPELDAACAPAEDRTLDLTPDGLRTYLGCYDPTVSFSGLLRVARRAAPDAPFVLDAESYGTVGASPAVTANELVVYTSGFDASVEPGLVYERTAPEAAFDAGFEIPGLAGMPTQAPDVSVDGLALFFGYEYGVWAATRESSEMTFSTPDAVIEPPADAPASSWNSAAISDDCRSLYAVRYVADTGAGQSAWTLEVFTR
jgi:hypothetical protein